MQQIFGLLIILIVSIQTANAVEDGRWVLTIIGFDNLEFGTEHLAGGLNIQWKTELEFNIKNSQFGQGTGRASLVGEITTFSRPEDMFDCKLEKGTFASRSGMNFSMPHLRYKAFPLTGKMVGETVHLNSFLEYPGNYYAVLYHCQTDNELGSFWIERSPRIARELSKRQNTATSFEEGIYHANIKEVKSISPGSQLELPLVDGLKFSVTQQFGLTRQDYALNRIADD